MIRRGAIVAVQGAVSLALLGYVAHKAGLGDALAVIRRGDAWLIALATLQLFTQPLLGALRWKGVIHALEGKLPFGATLRFFWIAAFFSQALPASVGGDIVRMWLYARRGATRVQALTSVMLERAFMVGSLLVLVLAIQPGLASRGVPRAVVAVTGASLGIVLAALALLLAFGRVFEKRETRGVFRMLLDVAAATRRMVSHIPAASAVFMLSLLGYFNMAVTMWLLALALSMNVTLLDCFVLAPLVVLAGVLPVSVGGWGAREGAAVVLFGLVGASRADALALAVLFGLAGLVVTLPGSILWLRLGISRKDIDELAAEPGVK